MNKSNDEHANDSHDNSDSLDTPGSNFKHDSLSDAKSKQESFTSLRNQADRGSAKAQFLVGVCYEEGQKPSSAER